MHREKINLTEKTSPRPRKKAAAEIVGETISKLAKRTQKKDVSETKVVKLEKKKNDQKLKVEKLFENPLIEASQTESKERALEPNIIGRPEKLFPNAPDMNRDDFLTKNGRYVDFTAATTLPELINLIREVGEVTNNNKQTLDADTIINLIYEFIYQPKPDWTKITLRHRLRETVYAVVEQYKKTPEYLNNLTETGLFGIQNLADLKAEIMKTSFWTLPNGLTVGNQTIITLIDQGFINDLPGPIKQKVVSINRAGFQAKEASKTETKGGLWSKVKSVFSKKWF